MRQVERALFDLRRGLGVLVRGGGGAATLVAPLEGLTDPLLADMRELAAGEPALVVTRHRLRRLGIDIAANSARVALTERDSARQIVAWGSAREARLDDGRIEPAGAAGDDVALALMRRGLLIPAAIVAAVAERKRAAIEARVADTSLLAVAGADIARYERAADGFVERVSAADVPLAESVRTRFVLFREADGMREHVALLIGRPEHWPAPLPVRLHSACLTGDLFASLRCDCGEQLRQSVARIGQRGGGVLLYLAQEGRGIGLANKLRAYALQDQGLDTMDADNVLGFGDDERDYNVALEMLAQLGIDHIDLLTNNPAKIRAMRAGGVTVAHRSGVYGRVTTQNRRYLRAKAHRAGHWLDQVVGDKPDER